MVIKRYFTVSLLMITCFLSAFFSLFNGFSALIEAEKVVKNEIKYGYQNEVRVYASFTGEIDIQNLLDKASEMKVCNIYLENLRFYFDESGGTYCPGVLLCQNENLPYPVMEGRSRIFENQVLVPSNILIPDDYLHIHEKQLQICGRIDVEKYEGLADYFVLHADDFYQCFEEQKRTNGIQFRICSNKVDVYHGYAELKQMIQTLYPDSYISYAEVERNSSVFDGFYSQKTILGLLLYVFALINVMILSFYWINIRKREISIRKAFGETSLQIVGLLLKEMLFIIVLAVVLAFGIQILIHIVRGNSSILFDGIKLFSFYLAVIILSVFVSVLIPIRYVMNIQPAEGIKL